MEIERMRALEHRYAPEERARIAGALAELARADEATYVVIDDDPTGGQTVHDVDVYTDWSDAALEDAFDRNARIFYIMTNSRSLTAAQTAEVHEQLMARIVRISGERGRPVRIISRGDSTLRGHYPLEPDIIRSYMGGSACRELLIPYFREGNRFTIGDVHYMRAGGALIPVGESEFGRDQTFGYRASDLKAWIEEKTSGRVPGSQVASISLDTLRRLDFDAVEAILTGERMHIVVNATCDEDLQVLAVAYLRAVKRGYQFVARTAAAWPKVIGMVSDRPLLTEGELSAGDARRGGLVVIGSHVDRTTRQLDALRAGMPALAYVQFDQHTAVDPARLDAEIDRVAALASERIERGETCVVYTRRERMDVRQGNREDQLRITQRIADAVTELVRRIRCAPRFIVAKGGITSSDIAVKALGVRRAVIRGQILPGVPVWRLGPESLCPGLDYVIFPGNVGEDGALREVLNKLI